MCQNEPKMATNGLNSCVDVRQTADVHAVSFLGMARNYKKAADLLFENEKTLSTPTYFLYAHAVELALKAFLRAQGLPIASDRKQKHHRRKDLYDECRGLGLKIDKDDFTNARNVFSLLDSADQEQGLRYFRANCGRIPEINWTRQTVEALIKAVEPSVKKKSDADGFVAGRAVKFDLALSKPYPSAAPRK